MNKNFCVIMAGGIGSRFWPVSRTSKPKQFLDIFGTGKTLIQQTFDRFSQLIPVENIFIVSNLMYRDLIIEQLPLIKPEQILLEPDRKNTAPCVALANYSIRKICPDANIIVTPSDHLIIKEEAFLRIIEKALNHVSKNPELLTIGIKPTRPETAYGYIQVADRKKDDVAMGNIKKVKAFTEKPDFELAKVFFESGDFYWNSGIFIWSLSTIMNAFEKYLPEIYFSFGRLFGQGSFTEQELISLYNDCQNISLDYGIMEKAGNVSVIPADFGWSDLGNWSAVYEQSQKDAGNNALIGRNIMTYETKNCLISMPKDKLLVINGLDGYVIVDSGDAMLICKMKDEQKIKNYVSDIQTKKGNSFI